jgi:hypothetical protein
MEKESLERASRLARAVVAATATISASVAASVFASSVTLSRAYVERGKQVERRERTLAVTGSARMRIRSDLATWSMRICGEGDTLEAAYARLAAGTDALREFLGARGLTGDGLSFDAIDTTVHYRRDEHGRETRGVQSYQLTRRAQLVSHDPVAIDRAAAEVTTLLRTGVQVESSRPSFVYTGLADLKVKMIGAATANGRERAVRIANESRCEVGVVKEARAGVLQVTAPWSSDVSDRGVCDTGSIEKDVTSVVHLVFALEPLP